MIDDVEELFGARKTKWYVIDVKVFYVVIVFVIFDDVIVREINVSVCG